MVIFGGKRKRSKSFEHLAELERRKISSKSDVTGTKTLDYAQQAIDVFLNMLQSSGMMN